MTDKLIKGRVVKFGDQVNTDVMAPGRWHRQGMDILRLHTMEAIRPDFYKQVRPGDVLVAGKNFGCGSHRESATAIMKVLGISAIVADSIARLYYRNCIALGIPVFGIRGISTIFAEGDEIEISIGAEGVVDTYSALSPCVARAAKAHLVSSRSSSRHLWSAFPRAATPGGAETQPGR